jgi:aldehyde:ferredoxin oxidoreductase
MFSTGSGLELSVEDLFTYAKRVRTMERAYEVGEGLTRESDTLPKSFFDNPIKSGPWKGGVLERERFEDMKSKFYTLRGWDPETGIPTEETLIELGLGDVAEDLSDRGILAPQE